MVIQLWKYKQHNGFVIEQIAEFKEQLKDFPGIVFVSDCLQDTECSIVIRTKNGKTKNVPCIAVARDEWDVSYCITMDGTREAYSDHQVL